MKVTKKEIQEILRTEDKTKIYRLAHIILDKKPNWVDVYKLITDYAPTKKIEQKAFELAFIKNKPYCDPIMIKRSLEYDKQNKKERAMKDFRFYITIPDSPYTKRPIINNGRLIFCSPVYGTRDYNQFYVMDVVGNEEFCEKLVRVADKYFPKVC